MSGHVQFGDDFAFSDIRAAVVLDDGSIARTLNGRPMTAGTGLYLRTPLEQSAEQLLEALKAMRVVMDMGAKPTKLDAALTWRECDEKARSMCDAAIAAATGEKA